MVNYLEATVSTSQFNTHVTDVRFSCDDAKDDNRKLATEIRLVREQPGGHRCCRGVPEDGKTAPAADTGREETIPLTENDLVFITPGSLVAHSSFGSQDAPARFAPELTPGDGWDLWKKIAAQSPEFGRPEKFCGDPEKSNWESATVTTLDEKILPLHRGHLQARPAFRRRCHGRHRVGEGLQLAALLDHQPPAAVPRPARGAGVRVALRPVHRRARRLREEAHARLHRQGNLRGWLYHLGVPEEQIEELAEYSANTVPCMMPYITAFFMPRADGDRPSSCLRAP